MDNFRVRGSVDAPALAIEPAVVLSWPASASGYVVEGAEGAEGPWTHLGFVPVAMDSMNSVTVRAAGGIRLYRLRKPFINE